jgi:hypothetical protein
MEVRMKIEVMSYSHAVGEFNYHIQNLRQHIEEKFLEMKK